MPVAFTAGSVQRWQNLQTRLFIRRERGNFSLRIEMHRRPAQFTPGFLAAQLLVHRAATSPVTEFGSNGIGGNNLRCVIAQPKSLRDRPRDAADRKTRNRRTNVARSRSSPFEREHVEIGNILAMDQRPAHVLATDHADRPPLASLGDELSEHAGCRLVHHGRMNDDRRDAFSFKDALQMRDHPGERRQRAKRRLFARDIVAGGAEQPAAAGVNECRLVRLRGKMRQQPSSRRRSTSAMVPSKAHARWITASSGGNACRHRSGVAISPATDWRRDPRLLPPNGRSAPERRHRGRGQLTRAPQARQSSRCRREREPASASLSRTLTGLTSMPTDGATDWMMANWPIPEVMVASRRTAARATPGAANLESAS